MPHFSIKQPATVADVGCGCRLRRPKLPSIFYSFRSKPPTPPLPPPPPPPLRPNSRTKRKTTESVAVVKESSEPYADFRESMVQMIVEKDLYGWDDLDDLLHRFLSLNSPRHHRFIFHAFADLFLGTSF